jgi:hypothetical protein
MQKRDRLSMVIDLVLWLAFIAALLFALLVLLTDPKAIFAKEATPVASSTYGQVIVQGDLAASIFEELDISNVVISFIGSNGGYVIRGIDVYSQDKPVVYCNVKGDWIVCPVPYTSLYGGPGVYVKCPSTGGDEGPEYQEWRDKCFVVKEPVGKVIVP